MTILKRCQKGYNRNKKTKNCDKKNSKKVCPTGSILNKKTNRCNKIKNKPVKKVCPIGSILNKKTNRCNKIKNKPEGKIFNPKTKRYIINNSKNKKKLNIKKTLKKSQNKIIINTKILTNECKKYNNIKYVDLNKLSLIENKIDNLCKNRLSDDNDLFKLPLLKLNYSLKYENIGLCYSKFLSKGAYGKVYEYSNNSSISVAIKSFKYSNDGELKIIEKLNKLNINCNTINARLLNIGGPSNTKKFAVMNIMSGGLNKMNGKLDIKNIYLVIKQIAEHLNCLNNNKLSYTDLKSDNILFKCIDNKEITTVLGDLGSICNKNSYNVCTWLPWDEKKTRGKPKCSESTMVWCLGVVLLELLKYSNINIFSWRYIPDTSELDMMKILKNINIKYKFNETKFNNSTKYKNGEELFNGIFNLNNKRRITLDNIIKTIVF